jgi:hypothetical protein
MFAFTFLENDGGDNIIHELGDITASISKACYIFDS